MFVVETRQADNGIWSHKYSLIIEQFAGEILQSQGRTWLQCKNSLSGDKEETEQSINTEHQEINSTSTLVRKIGEYLKQYTQHNNMNSKLLHTHFRYEEHIMASLIGNQCTWERK